MTKPGEFKPGTRAYNKTVSVDPTKIVGRFVAKQPSRHINPVAQYVEDGSVLPAYAKAKLSAYEVDYRDVLPVTCSHVAAEKIEIVTDFVTSVGSRKTFVIAMLTNLLDDQSYSVVHQFGSGVYEDPRRAHIRRIIRDEADTPELPSPDSESLRQKFEHLKTVWRRKSAKMSVVADKVLIPEYQQIIGLGRPALPLIIDSLRTEGGHWFWALVAITGEDHASGAETVKEAKERWIEWYDSAVSPTSVR
ncbi:hypothetical protein ACAG24_009745 [Mycobacterium sp. pW049]|uniref:hypothetical protein n=1 Tax=[Mycobacterium] bulgaricum TaxID=3238985 RepID=UPI00351BDA3A